MNRILFITGLVLAAVLSLWPQVPAQADHCAHDGYYVREYWHGGHDAYGKYWNRGWYRTWYYYPKRHVNHQTYSVSIDPDKEFYKQAINKLIDLQAKAAGADVAPKTPTTAAEVYALRCMSCHGTEAAAKAKGSDFVLNPGALSASERTNIKARATTTDAAKRMPPGMQLPAAEVKLLTD